MINNSKYLFAYGTLQQEFKISINDKLTKMLSPKEEGIFIGQLFEVNQYPGAIISETGYPIKGQLFEVLDKKAWQLMDDYEECSEQFPTPYEYKREQIIITTKEGKTIKAWTYLYNRPTNDLTEITSGDYLHFYQLQKQK